MITCPVCKGTSFTLTHHRPLRADRELLFVKCSQMSCGAAIGFTDSGAFNIVTSKISALTEAVKQIANKVGAYVDL